MLRSLMTAVVIAGFAAPAFAQNSTVIIQEGQGTAINHGEIHQQGPANTAVLNQVNALVNSGVLTQVGGANVIACIQQGTLLNTCIAQQRQ